MLNLKRKKIWILALVFVLTAATIAGAGCQPQEEPTVQQKAATLEPAEEQPTATEKPAEPTQITVSRLSDLLFTDPAFITSGSDYSIAYLIYNSLVKFKPGTQEIVGDLAERWEVAPDGLRYTFWLQKGVKWHKGYGELTAHDVKYTFERIMDPETESRFYSDFANVDRIEVEDDYTVHIHMKEPYPEFMAAALAYRPGYIVNQKAIEEFGEEYLSNPIGTGPYEWEKWETGVEVVLKKNTEYFGPEPFIDRVVMKKIGEETSSEIALEAGDLDMSYFEEPEIQRRLIENPELVTLQTPGPRTMFITLNITREPWSDVRVRQALVHATDRQKIIDTVMEGMGVPAYTMLNPNMFAFNNEQVYEYDPEKAKELLTEAGYPDGFDQTFEYVTSSGLYADIGAVLQQDWKDLGINFEITTLERAQYQEKRKAADFDFLALGSARLQPAQYLAPYLSSDGIPYPNVIGYAGADEYIFEAMKTVDDAKRKELYILAQKQLQKDVPFIFLAYPVFVLAHHPNIEGAEIGLFLYNIMDIRFTD